MFDIIFLITLESKRIGIRIDKIKTIPNPTDHTNKYFLSKTAY